MTTFWSKAVTELQQTLLRQHSLFSYLEPLLQWCMPGFQSDKYQARVLAAWSEAGCWRLRLQLGRGYPAFRPGQHLQLFLQQQGRWQQRTFSICSDLALFLQHRQLELAIRLQSGGQFTALLPELATAGALVHVSAPQGDFVLEQGQPSCLLAAGSGVTPLFSMLSSVRRLTRPMLFIYSYRGEAQQLFASEWRSLQQRFPLLQLMLWDTQQLGRLTPAVLLEKLAPDLRGRFYLCGPVAFATAFREQLLTAGVASAQIRQECYGTTTASSQGPQPVLWQQGHQQYWLKGQGNLLQRAEQSGLQPQFGCRRGICMQCLCQKKSGQVRNLLTGEISDAGTGHIQLCISEAVSAVELVAAPGEPQ